MNEHFPEDPRSHQPNERFPEDPRAPRPFGYFAIQYRCHDQGPRPAGPCLRVIGHKGEHDDGHGRRWEQPGPSTGSIVPLDEFDREFYSALLDFETSSDKSDNAMTAGAIRVAFRLRVRAAMEKEVRRWVGLDSQ